MQAVCDFVHRHIRFDYLQARANRTALDVYRERVGVCRDYMHLAVTFCRSLNIPARYCTGYLGDIGVPRQIGADGFQRLVRGLPGRRGTPSTPGTTRRASAASSWPAAATPPTSPSRRRSGRIN